MVSIRAQDSLKKLEQALDRLDDILQEPLSEKDYILDATIQRFEFVMELYWKSLKHLLADQGISTNTPKEALQEAFSAGWINDEELWLNMLRDRNLTSHTYKHENAVQIYQNVKGYFPEMRLVFTELQKIA